MVFFSFFHPFSDSSPLNASRTTTFSVLCKVFQISLVLPHPWLPYSKPAGQVAAVFPKASAKVHTFFVTHKSFEFFFRFYGLLLTCVKRKHIKRGERRGNGRRWYRRIQGGGGKRKRKKEKKKRRERERKERRREERRKKGISKEGRRKEPRKKEREARLIYHD